jgi:hypothetical protein
MPTVSSTLLGDKYVFCPGHCETEPRRTAAEAVSLWNAGKFERCEGEEKKDQATKGQQDWPVL